MQSYNQTAKADAGKPRPTLVPTAIIQAIAQVREYGCRKYPEDSWKDVETQRYWEAVLRHTLAAWKGISPAEMTDITWNNALRLFGLEGRI